VRGHIDQQRRGEDIGGLYFASGESLWLTGNNLVIDGGMGVKSGFTEHAGNRVA
jgi:hypothetical protein